MWLTLVRSSALTQTQKLFVSQTDVRTGALDSKLQTPGPSHRLANTVPTVNGGGGSIMLLMRFLAAERRSTATSDCDECAKGFGIILETTAYVMWCHEGALPRWKPKERKPTNEIISRFSWRLQFFRLNQKQLKLKSSTSGQGSSNTGHIARSAYSKYVEFTIFPKVIQIRIKGCEFSGTQHLFYSTGCHFHSASDV